MAQRGASRAFRVLHYANTNPQLITQYYNNMARPAPRQQELAIESPSASNCVVLADPQRKRTMRSDCLLVVAGVLIPTLLKMLLMRTRSREWRSRMVRHENTGGDEVPVHGRHHSRRNPTGALLQTS